MRNGKVRNDGEVRCERVHFRASPTIPTENHDPRQVFDTHRLFSACCRRVVLLRSGNECGYCLFHVGIRNELPDHIGQLLPQARRHHCSGSSFHITHAHIFCLRWKTYS